MTALPMTLETALRHEGFTIDTVEADELTITTDLGVIVVPPEVRSVLTWGRPGTPELGDDFYLSKLPMFAEDYRPVLLSSILDQYRTRRLGYNTPGEFRLAVRRWGNLHMPLFNQRYASTAVAMPLDDLAVTDHTLDVSSDFPQSLVSGSFDYASTGVDHKAAENGRRRSIASLLEEQRTAYLNVTAEVVAAIEPLFLGIFDRGELGSPDYDPPHGARLGFWGPSC